MVKPSAPADKRSVVVDLAKGIAITLVVIAHYHPDDSPGWWNGLNDLISQIDVRVFFFLAGYVWHLRPGEPYLSYLGRKARRLLIPYFALAVLFLSIKIVPSHVMHLVNPVSLASVANIFIDPLHSYVPLLWFLYSLFCIQAVFPAIQKLGPRTFPVLIVIAGVWGIPTMFLCLGPTWENLPCFLAGAYVAQVLRIDLDRDVSRNTLLPAVIGTVLFLSLWELRTPGAVLGERVSDALLGTIGVTATILVCRSIAGCKPRWLTVLAYIGASSMTIYLFHTLFESSARVVCYQVPMLRSFSFLAKAVAAIVAGVALPIAVQRLVIHLRALWSLKCAGRDLEQTTVIPEG